jgi:hypothetical protein
MALFVSATRAYKQGQLGYAKTLSALAGRMSLDQRPLALLSSAIRADGGAIPRTQALAITKPQVTKFLSSSVGRTRAATLLAWKTCSRWAESRKVRSPNILKNTKKEIVVDWGTVPKGRRSKPWVASRYAVIRGPHTAELSTLLRKYVTKHADLSDLSSAQLTREFHAAGLKGMTSRSLKRGAVTHLTEQVARRNLDPRLIPTLAKHKVPDPVLPETTMRYGANPLAMARLLGTARATALL